MKPFVTFKTFKRMLLSFFITAAISMVPATFAEIAF